MGSVIVRKRVLWNPYTWGKMRPAWVEEMDPEEDRMLLTWLANHALEPGKTAALRKLGCTEAPSCPWRRVPSGEREEEYRVLKEQVEREDDRKMIEQAALDAPVPLSFLARCRITGRCEMSPEDDEWSFMTYECEQLPGITPEYAAEFERKWKRHRLRLILPPGCKLFESPFRNTWTPENVHMIFGIGEILKLDPSADRLLMENLARHIGGFHQKYLLEKLGISEPPEPGFTPDEERYRILREQVQRISSPEFLEEVAFGGRDDAGCFTFCRLTGYAFREDGTRSFACGQTENASRKESRAFCERMAKENGPFAKEAVEYLHSFP